METIKISNSLAILLGEKGDGYAVCVRHGESCRIYHQDGMVELFVVFEGPPYEWGIPFSNSPWPGYSWAHSSVIPGWELEEEEDTLAD